MSDLLNSNEQQSAPVPVARLKNVHLRYGHTHALDGITLDLPAGRMVGLIGPDGVGKSSMLSLIAGARRIQEGQVEVLGGDMADARHRWSTCPRIAYMPQGLGKNLYPTLSVFENADFFGRLFGYDAAESKRRIADLLESTGLGPFADRPAGKLSGGMKQKLSLCCALIHDPDLLILDEPTTGVDPLSRRQFWQLIDRIRGTRPGMSVLVATAYMEEAEQFEFLIAMDAGRVLATATPAEILSQTGTRNLDAAFIALLPEEKRRGHVEVKIPPRSASGGELAIEARDLTQRFGNFVAVDHVSFRIERGEIFGFLGSNGCGKTTTMKMLTGLLPATEGTAWLFGREVNAEDITTRRRVGYMSQAFSLYSELTVRQNLVLHARLFEVPEEEIPGRVDQAVERFGLTEAVDALPDSLPLGQRQRLSLAVALIHRPDLLILDEPTSGVDPVARDSFWQSLIELSRRDNVTIFISTHFMNEAERCDRISLMHAGRVLTSNKPATLVEERGSATLGEAFISYLEEAASGGEAAKREPAGAQALPAGTAASKETASEEHPTATFFSLARLLSYTRREALELSRDPIRMMLAGLGSVILMILLGYGITLDVERLSFAVLDRDQTALSRDYVLNIFGTPRYFVEQTPIVDYEDLDHRMRSGSLSMAVEIPPKFAANIERGRRAEVGVWIDGAMPQRGETIRSYVLGLHNLWLSNLARHGLGQRQQLGLGQRQLVEPATVELRYRYNPDVKSLPAFVPTIIPLLLLLIPAILAALSVVREKDLGSIINFYVTPSTRLEFLLGKQLAYVALGTLNFLLLAALSVFYFKVPLKGSFAAETTAAALYVSCSTAMGLLISTLTRTQVAAIFATAILTLLPALNFSGLTDPVSSLEGVGAIIGSVYPTAHFLTITRGTFSKALGFVELRAAYLPLLIALLVLVGLSVSLLKKQET